MKRPPSKLANVPLIDIPPFVPGGTRLKVVISLGVVSIAEPNSDANVSPQQHDIEAMVIREEYLLLLPLNTYTSDEMLDTIPLQNTCLQFLFGPNHTNGIVKSNADKVHKLNRVMHNACTCNLLSDSWYF